MTLAQASAGLSNDGKFFLITVRHSSNVIACSGRSSCAIRGRSGASPESTGCGSPGSLVAFTFGASKMAPVSFPAAIYSPPIDEPLAKNASRSDCLNLTSFQVGRKARNRPSLTCRSKYLDVV